MFLISFNFIYFDFPQLLLQFKLFNFFLLIFVFVYRIVLFPLFDYPKTLGKFILFCLLYR